MRTFFLVLLLCLSFCLAIWQGEKATDFAFEKGCTTDYNCEQMEQLEKIRELYHETEKAY